MNQITTQCPKCDTSFRVTEAQLRVAKGKVRCGSCLHVFKAEDHWVNPPAEKTAAAKVPAGKESPAKVAGKFAFDQAAIDGSSAEKILTQPAAQAVNTLGEIRAIAAKPQPAFEDDEGFIIDDEVADHAEEKGVSSMGGDDYSDLFLNLDDLGDDGFNAIVDDESEGSSKGKNRKAEAADESWAKDILSDLEDDTKEREAQVKNLFNAGARDNVFADDGHVKKKVGARDGFVSGNQNTSEKDLDLGKPPARPPLNRKELLSKIEPAPVEMDWSGNSRDWLGLVLWSTLTFFAVLGLLLQYAVHNFESLAREPSYRPLYATACEFIGCELPDLFNPAAIRSSNLLVRFDSALPNVLIVDAILQNNASYEQLFPDLELYFSDLDGFPVASRRFHPREYLAGEMAGKTRMPPSRSIHISLQIVDPGEKAVNYRIQISDKKPVNG